MEPIFNTPVSSIQCKQLFWGSFFWRQAGYSIDEFYCFLIGGKVGNFSTNTAYLSHIGKVKVTIFCHLLQTVVGNNDIALALNPFVK